MKNINNPFTSLVNEANGFLENTDKSESLHRITELFNAIKPFEQSALIPFIKEKVFNHISFDKLNQSQEKSTFAGLKLFQEKQISPTENTTSKQSGKRQTLSTEEIMLISILISEKDPQESLKQLKIFLSRYEGDLNDVVFKGNALADHLLTALSFGDLETNKQILNICAKNPSWKEKPIHAEILSMVIKNSVMKEEEKIEFLNDMVKKNFDFNRYPTCNPLSVAIDTKNNALIEFFLDEKLNIKINKNDISYGTPLFQAIKQKNYEVLEILLQRGVKTSRNEYGHPKVLPYEYVKLQQDTKALELLDKYGAWPHGTFPENTLNQLSVVKVKRDPGYKEEVKILKSSLKMKSRSDKEISIKKISHSFSLKGKFLVSDKSKEEPFSMSLEGLPSAYKNYKVLAKRIKNSVELLEKNEKIQSGRSYKTVENVFMFTSQNLSHQEHLDRFNSGKWVLLDTGFLAHTVTVALKKDSNNKEARIFICNLGPGARNDDVDCFTFDPDKLDVVIIEKLREGLVKEKIKDYEKYIYEMLPKLLNFQHGDIEQKIEDLCHLETQTVGNCTYASPEMASKLIFMADIFEKEGLLGERIFSEGDGLAYLVSDEFEDIRRLNRLQELKEYLDLHDDEKFPYPLDVDYFKRALLTLWSGKPSPLIKDEIQKIENRFFEMIGENPVTSSLYRIQKSWFSAQI